MAQLMISVSGIRGVIGNGFTPAVVEKFVAAFGSWIGGGKVVIGRDTRVTGEMIEHIVLGTLQAVGCEAVRVGVVPTPTVEYAVETLKARGGIIITASHNPIQWNALKLISEAGLFLDEEQGNAVLEIANRGELCYQPWNKIGSITNYDNAIRDHMDAILRLPFIDLEGIRRRRFRVALDCVNGAGSVFLPKFLEELGCEIISLNTTPNGLFPHTPEPVPENLQQLCTTVKTAKADIGFACDPDADRLAIVSETGEPIGEEYTLTLAVRFMLSKRPGVVVVNASTTRAVDDIAAEFNSQVIRTKVGEIHVAKKMKEVKAVIGGEGNGGVILPDVHLGRDAPVATALTLQHLLEFGGTISQLHRNLPQYQMIKKKIEIGDSDPEQLLQKIRQKYQHEKLDEVDGLKILYPESWVHLRKSNTEPIIRIIAEARNKEKAASLCDQIIHDIQQKM